MSLLAGVRQRSTAFVGVLWRVRTYAARAGGESGNSSTSTKLPVAETTHGIFQSCSAVPFALSHLTTVLGGTSSCPPGTILTGLNYLKGQPPVVALPDEDYPPWLWKLLESKNLVDDGPGGKAEKVRLRKENRQRIRDQNLLKTQ